MNKPKYYNKILCIGDSHASKCFTPHPWPHWVGESLDCEIDVLCSPGAGSQIGVDKLALALSQKSYDLVIFQMSHEYRNSIGMNHSRWSDNSGETKIWEESGNLAGDEFIMGLNPSNNVNAMSKFFGKEDFKKQIFETFNEWYIQYVADNTYELYIKQLQQMFAVQQICNKNSTSCKIFTWHPFLRKRKGMLFNGWISLIDLDHVINRSAEESLESAGMKSPYHKYEATPVHPEWSVDGYHLNDQGSKWLVENLLVPDILK